MKQTREGEKKNRSEDGRSRTHPPREQNKRGMAEKAGKEDRERQKWAETVKEQKQQEGEMREAQETKKKRNE